MLEELFRWVTFIAIIFVGNRKKRDETRRVRIHTSVSKEPGEDCEYIIPTLEEKSLYTSLGSAAWVGRFECAVLGRIVLAKLTVGGAKWKSLHSFNTNMLVFTWLAMYSKLATSRGHRTIASKNLIRTDLLILFTALVMFPVMLFISSEQWACNLYITPKFPPHHHQ